MRYIRRERNRDVPTTSFPDPRQLSLAFLDKVLPLGREIGYEDDEKSADQEIKGADAL